MEVRKLRAQLDRVVAAQRRVRDVRRASGRSDPRAETALRSLEAAEEVLRKQISLVQSAESKTDNGGQGRTPQVVCPKCKLKLRKEKGVPVKAHLHPSSNGSWCAGGAAPSLAEKVKAESKRRAAKDRNAGSVRTVSGGLPTLGKRR